MKRFLFCLFMSLVLTNAHETDFFEVAASSTVALSNVYNAIDEDLNSFWSPSPAFNGPQNFTVSFSSAQVLGNLTWVITSFTDYDLILYGPDNIEVGRYGCNGTCNVGETRLLPSPDEVSKVTIDLVGINALRTTSPSLWAQEIGRFKIFSVFAHALCNVGSPYDFQNAVCNDNCGIVPDPYQYQNVPVLDMEKLKLETNGVLTISFDMEGVQSRVVNILDIAGSQSCDNAALVPWQQLTSNNTCAIEMNSKYQWSKLWTSCPNNLKFFETNDSASAWFLVEVGFLENITVNNGLKRFIAPRGVVTRDFLAEYSIGIYTNRFVVLESVINITLCLGVVCPAADQCHEDGYCDPANGQCVFPPKSDNTTCNDNQLCTQYDTCQSGSCVGTPVQCTSSPSQCYDSTGYCNPNDGSCSYNPVPDNSTCDDGDPCTINDNCQSGVCKGTPKQCPAIDSCHSAGVCDSNTGLCSAPVVQNGTLCDDQDNCTYSDQCSSGVCSGIPVTCSGDQCNDAGTCDPTSGQCVPNPKTNGTSCNDQNYCTQTDACYSGVCVGSNPIVCSSSDQCHDVGTCDPNTGYCSDPVRPDTYPCDDSNYCTQNDTCVSGVCVGSNPVVCSAQDQCHEVGTCNPSNGQCSNPVSYDGKSCSDSLLCTYNDTCHVGVCVGTPVVCSAQDQCHEAGTCDSQTGLCPNPVKPNGTVCDDNDLCTPSSECDLSGNCVATSTVTCSPLGDCYQPGVCNSTSGICDYSYKADGTSCSDSDYCTQNDTCVSGACVGSNPIVCSALDQCHDVGSCNPATGICSNPDKSDNSTCDDSDSCTQDDYCVSGSCVGHNPVICSYNAGCNSTDVCLPANGTCIPTCEVCNTTCNNPPPCHVGPGTCDSNGQCVYSLATDYTSCSDDDLCTAGDYCLAGVCTANTTTTCQAIDDCHDVGTCNPQTGLCSNPISIDGTYCNDHNACTQNDTCASGYCVGSNPVTCSAPDQCHQNGVCNTTSGSCEYQPKADGTTCDDNDLCTYNDACLAGVCNSQPVVCSNPGQCEDYGACDSTSGSCVYVPKTNGTACSDSNACTYNDACYLGICVPGTPVVCQAQDQCHDAGVCDPQNGVCSQPPKTNGAYCDDNDLCTYNETCQAGVCTPSTQATCEALDQCHEVGVCNPATGLCSNPNSNDGKTCNDTNLCSQNDYCEQGTCVGHSYTNCSASDQCHDAGVCDPVTGQCSNPNKADGSTCNDNDLCTQTDQCYQGSCVGKYPITCNADTECVYAGVCDPTSGTCDYTNKPDNLPCDDSDLCTLNDRCVSGVCTPNNTVSCAQPDQCHNQGVCNPLSGVCTNPTKPDGTSCVDDYLCTSNDTCTAGVCSGLTVVCPTASCGSAGVCKNDTGICSNPCPPTVTGAIVSQQLRNQFPFEIKLATFTSNNETLDSGYLSSAPYNGNWTLKTNSSENQYASNGIVTQFWKFSFTPEGTCELDGNYIFNFLLTNYPNTFAPLTFYFDSQYFCGQISNTSITGSVKIYNDSTYVHTSTIFNQDDLLWVQINVESAFTVTLVELVALSVNNQTYPEYGLDNTEQIYYGMRFSMVALIPPFQLNSNVIQFTVRVTLGAGKRTVLYTERVEPDNLKFQKSVGIRANNGGTGAVTSSNSTSSTGDNIFNQSGEDHNGGGSSAVYIAVGSVLGIGAVAGIVFVVVWKARKAKSVLGGASLE